MTALYATTGLLGLACALCVAAYRRKQVAGESEAPFAIGGGADEFSLFHDSEIDRG